MYAARTFLLCVLVFCASSGLAMAQEAPIVTGVVTTRPDGLPVPGAVVSVVGGDATATTATVNSFNGIQTFPSHSPFGMNGRALVLRVGRTF